MTAIVDIYCRVSTDPQENNSSLDEQEQSGRAFCAENNLIVGQVHRETFSGYVYRERPKLTLMRERYREGKIQGVVIRTLDRLSRSQIHNAILMEEMEHHKVMLYSVKENLNAEDSVGKFIRMILSFVAEMEREKIMDRTITGRINRAKEGKIVSGKGLRYGWKWHDPDVRDYIVLDDPAADIIRWASEEYASGVPCLNLVTQLNERCVPSPNGEKLWVPRTLRRMLTDERNTGKNVRQFTTQSKKSKQNIEPVDMPDGTYPAIISEELFNRILMRAGANKEDSARNGSDPQQYLLRAGIARCSICNHAMVGRELHDKRSGSSWHIYECHKTHICPGHRVKANELDTKVWNDLVRLADHIPLIEQAINLATKTDTFEANLKAVEATLATWREQAENYTTDLQNPTLRGNTRASIVKLLDDANGMIEQFEAERAQILAGVYDKERERVAYAEILDWCKKVKEAREELTYTRKRDFLRMLGVTVLVDKRNRNIEEMSYDIRVGLPSIQELIYVQSENITGHLSRITPHNMYFIGINKAGLYINPALLDPVA